jgi:uncharacterized damage-inducible protein DinB
MLDRGSIRDTLVHVLDTQEFWLARCRTAELPAELNPTAFETIDDLSTRWSATADETHSFLAQLPDSEIDKELHYTSNAGQEYANPVWAVLTHMANHAMQHRSEIALMVTKFGHSPGNLDFIIYMTQARTTPG